MKMNPKYSIIIPAFNEEKYIMDTIKSLKNAVLIQEDKTGVEGEIILVDNNSTDRTAEIAKTEGVKVVFEPVNCIAKARNAGASASKGEFLFFVDADTMIPPELLENAISILSSGKVCAGGAKISFIEDNLPAAAEISLAIWHSIVKVVPFAAGSFVYCTREAFQYAGGFDEKLYAGEEILLSIRLKKYAAKNGMNFRVIPIPVRTSGRKFEWYGTAHLLSRALIIMLFPHVLKNKIFCKLWYDSSRK